ncbi:MAG TPA: DNRLRE domain-containing protein [Micromonosporaceae bacterium]
MGYARRLLIGFLGIVVGLSVVTGVALRPQGSPFAIGQGWRTGLTKALSDLVGGARPAPETAGHISLARNQHPPTGQPRKPATRVKELTDRRTATTRVFQMSDGRLQAEVSATPRFYRDSSGRWQPIDTTVKPDRTAGYAFANVSNTFTSRFGVSADQLVRFELAGRTVSMGIAGTVGRLSPTVSKDTVTYAGLASGLDVSYQVTTQALKERLVLRDASAPSSLTFTLDAGDLRVSQRKDGAIEFRSPEDDRVLLVMPAPFMTDSHEDAASPYGYSFTRKVTQTLHPARDGAFTIDVDADRGWLTDPHRVYPVTIDPTIKIQPTVSQSQDAMIISDDPTGNYDGNWRLSVGTTNTGVARSLVKFDLSTIPANTTIDSASLQMYFDQDFVTSSYDVPMEARQVTAAWDQSTVTWSSINTAMGTGAATVVTVDDTDSAKIAMKGSWPASGSTLTQYGIDKTYRYNKDDVAGDTFTWVPDVPEDGTYTVDAHYVTASDRSTAASYTVYYNGGSKNTKVDQQVPGNADWATLGTYGFLAGTSQKVVLDDSTASSSVAVIADAIRLTKAGAVKKADEANVWHSYPVTNLVQSWLNGTANYGFMLKASDEATLGHGGPRYEASEYAYNGENENSPKLIVNYGKPGVTLDAPTTIYDTGAALHWSAYTGSDIVEYQVHRSIYQTFTPSASTLVAPVDKSRTSFTDTTATPTPVDSTDPFGQVYYYMVVVKTSDGTLIPSPTQIVALPRAGRVEQVLQGSAPDTTLSSAQPTTNQNVLAGHPWLMVGNSSSTYGTTRAVVKFDTTSIPTDAKVLDAYVTLWESTMVSTNNPGTASYEMHALTRDFDQSTATWNSAAAGTAWSTAGGDYDATVSDSLTSLTNDPARRSWGVTSAAQGWVADPSSNHGVLVKLADEAGPAERTIFLSSEAAEPQLRPKLVVTYTQPIAERTYYAPTTQSIRMIPGDQYTIPVTINNPTSGTWSAADWELSYHWALPDGTDVTTGGNQMFTPLPSDVAPGVAVDVNATVKTPINSDSGNKRTEYVLKWELHNKTTGAWLSSTGIGTLDQPVVVEDPTSDQLGMEKFYQYSTVPTGAGGTALVNGHAGNVAWGYNAFSNPGRGLSTSVRITYNSLDTTDSSMGYGWSLSASTLSRLGSPLRFHPPGQDWPTEVRLTDGDGTTHVFSLNKHNSTDTSLWDYDHPAGVHLYLQKNSGAGDPSRAWVMTAPDRTQFFFDSDGYPSAVVDHTGNNTQTFTYASRKSNNEPIKFLQYITDPSGRRTLNLTYYAKGDSYSYIDDAGNLVNDSNLTNPKIIDQVKSITDVGGRTITFTYTTKGLMARMVDGAGTSIAKTFNFAYDMTQGNKNVKLVKVTDPRGNSTSLAYYDPPADPQFHWWVDTITSRIGGVSTFAYTDPDGTSGSTIQTAVTDPENHTSTYTTDGYGRPTSMVNALNQTTSLGWDADNNVTQLTEDNGAITRYTYDANTGYPLTVQDAEAVKNGWPATRMTYATGLNGHIADLATKTSPEGRQWAFGYDPVGNLTSVTDPDGTATSTAGDYTTTYTYDSYGQVQTATDANGHTTRYSNFDSNGYPQTTTDALNHDTNTAYDTWGHVTSVTDPLGKTSTYSYDIFGRPLDRKVPKDQANGVYIVTPAPVYDANDNVTTSTAPNGAVRTYTFDENDRMISATEPKHASGDPDRVTTYTYDKVGNVLRRTDPLGTLTTDDPNDHSTSYGYDAIYELTSVTDAKGGVTTYSYDNVGNMVRLVDPRKNATADTSDYTETFGYDAAHRRTTVTDATGKTATKEYDKDGLVIAQTDRAGNRTTISYDARGKQIEVKVPRRDTGGGVLEYAVTKYEYDQVGNRTKVISPRGTATSTADDFTQTTVYDELNRVAEQDSAYDAGDSRYNTPDKTFRSYDAAGHLVKVSAPPSNGQTVRNDTTYTYFDNGWIATSTDPWDIVTSYDYDELGDQTLRKVSAADGSTSRTQTWSFYPDGKLSARTDSGVPVGLTVVVVDNSDTQNVAATGTWSRSSTQTGYYGYDYASHAAGAGSESFTWTLNVTQAGTYQVYVRYPQGTATNAGYTITSSGGASTTRTVDQTRNAGTWVSLGSYSFDEGNSQTIRLTDAANGTVNADAVKLVRDNSGDVDNEQKDYTYGYDAEDNMTSIHDNSSGALVDDYAVAYDTLDQVARVTESRSGTTKHTTTFSYDENGNVTGRTHDSEVDTYTYDVLDLLSKVSNATSASDPNPKVTTYTYTPVGQTAHETKANGNTVDYEYFLDGALRHQIEKKSDGTVVSEHTYAYDLNDNRTSDTSKVMNADDHSAYINRVATYTYTPRDQVATVTRTDPGNGSQVGSESYVYDANSNVVSQTVDGTTTTSTYDRNRLLSATRGGVVSSYNYDPYGRLDTVTAAGQIVDRFVYDGFDRVVEERTQSTTTDKTYDPLDRTATKTEHAGTSNAKTTTYAYLGLTDQLLNESSGGKTTRTYRYSPFGDRLSQTKTNSDGTTEDAYYGYNGHDDVETLTDSSGATKSTYGYTAYGSDDSTSFTGVDKPDPQDPTKETYNPYRFNAKRWDSATGDYDMGFRDYDPHLNRFLTRDAYNGALADMHLAADPWTGNRYSFAGGNPVTGIELDGHDVRHDAALLATAAEIESWAMATGTNGYVTTDVGPGGHTANKIPGGASDGSGGPGYADIIFWGDDVVYIWEIKPNTEYGRTKGPGQLQRYIQKLQEDLAKKGDHRKVMAGPAMPRVGNVPTPTGPIDVWSKGPGMRYYGSSRNKPTQPTPTPVPVPVPVPVPQPQTQSQPSDDGFHMPGWVAPVGGGALIVGGLLLGGGTLVEDFFSGGAGIADDPISFAGAGSMIRSGWGLLFG